MTDNVDIPQEKMNHMMNTCRAVARKYNNRNEYEDMVSEGVLACLELLAKDPNTNPITLYREANRAISDYLTFGCTAISIPASDMARRVARDKDVDTSKVDNSYSDSKIDQRRVALSMKSVPVVEDTLAFAPSSEDLYQTKEQVDKVLKVMGEQLTEDELLFAYMRFVEGMTQKECGDFFGDIPMASSRKERMIVSKIREFVV